MAHVFMWWNFLLKGTTWINVFIYGLEDERIFELKFSSMISECGDQAWGEDTKCQDFTLFRFKNVLFGGGIKWRNFFFPHLILLNFLICTYLNHCKFQYNLFLHQILIYPILILVFCFRVWSRKRNTWKLPFSH